MKLSTLVLLILFVACGYYYWEHATKRDAPDVLPHAEKSKGPEAIPSKPEPAALAPPEPEPPIIMAMAAPVIPETPALEPEVEPDDPIDIRSLIRETLQHQRSVEVPHALDNAITISGHAYREAVVFRIEPDGINIRHAEGIIKIFKEEMQPEWRARYHMNPLVAAEYRVRRADRERTAWEAARERERMAEEQRRQVLHEGHLTGAERRAERQRQREADEIARRRWAWEQYDRDLAAWQRRQRSVHRASPYSYRTTTTRAPRPTPPPYPRPH